MRGQRRTKRGRNRTEQLLSGASGLDPWTNVLWRSLLRRRTIGVFLLAVAALAIPAMGPRRWLIALGLALVGPVYHWALQRSFRATGRIPQWMAYTDVALCVAFPIAAPVTFWPALLVLVSIISLSAATIGTRPATLSIAIACIGASTATILWHPHSAVVGVVAMTVSAAVGTATIGPVAENAVRMRARFGSLVEGIDGIVWEAEPVSGGRTYVSPQIEAILGYRAEEAYSRGFWHDHLHPDDRVRAGEVRRAAMKSGLSHELDYRFIAADGRIVHLHDSVAVTHDPLGRPATLQGITLDVTEREETLEQLRQYGDLVESISLGLIVIRMADIDDPESFDLVAANPAACAALNRPLDQWAGRRVAEVLPVLAGTDLLEQAAKVAITGSTFERESLVMRPGQPNEQALALHIFPLPNHAVGVSLEDVTVSIRASAELQRQALHDGLTGLPNRNHLRSRLVEALTAARSSGTTVALLVMDLDQFKEINDALGHHVGDLLLTELGARLRQLARGDDMVARLGGDEFAILMTSGVTEPGAVIMAKRIRAALLEPFALGELRIQTNASIGIAVHPDHGDDADSLTQRADVAMYQAKRSGTGHAVYKAELDRSSIRRLTLLSELRHALDEGQFLMHYQPVVSVADGRTVRAEALVRWDHPTHGLIGPDDFIELAEVSGFIQPLTHWILAESIGCADRWWRAGHRVGVAVNLSVRNLYDPGLPAHVRDVLADSSLPPDHLMLEVTESELMDDPALAMEVLGEIHQLGVTAGVDDFGTGYSSLSYLRNLPVGEIKIDRSFVAGMGSSADDLTIVRSTIELGHNLGLSVVAEGVEDAVSLGQLGALGCDLAQGYHIARPMPIDEFRRWLGHPPPPPPTPTPRARTAAQPARHHRPRRV